jgi:transposase
MKPQHSLKKSPVKAAADRVVKDIRRQTRRHFSAEDKIRIVLDGLRGEDSIAELCRKEGPRKSARNQESSGNCPIGGAS